MEIILLTSFVFTLVLQTNAALQDPFPGGYSMGNLGTIVCKDGPGGLQPWMPAAFGEKKTNWGLSAGAVSFYDKMGNFKDRSIYRVTGGGWFGYSFMNLKMSISQLDVLGVYYEQSVFGSAGISVFSLFDMSIEAAVYRTGLRNTKKVRTTGELGISLWLPINLVSLAVSAEHCVIKKSGSYGADPPFTIRTGIHTELNRFGAQGVVIEIIPEYQKPIRLIIGEEYRILRWLGIHAAVGNNPVMIGIGLVIDWKKSGGSAALVNHPVLGWSRGFSVFYSKYGR